jgi:hypothetical protein
VLRDRVREIWKSDDPSKRLLDSLLLDYATEAVTSKGESHHTGRLASKYQIEAAVRLLYYFPKETSPLIAARLQALDVKAATLRTQLYRGTFLCINLQRTCG